LAGKRAETLLQDLHRDLAGPEARHPDLLADLLKAVLHFFGDVARRDDDLVLPYQAVDRKSVV
jgi:hypothetical protein